MGGAARPHTLNDEGRVDRGEGPHARHGDIVEVHVGVRRGLHVCILCGSAEINGALHTVMRFDGWNVSAMLA